MTVKRSKSTELRLQKNNKKENININKKDSYFNTHNTTSNKRIQTEMTMNYKKI